MSVYPNRYINTAPYINLEPTAVAAIETLRGFLPNALPLVKMLIGSVDVAAMITMARNTARSVSVERIFRSPLLAGRKQAAR
ncbi:hypothetical protein CRN84_10465 [Budvicia aquatica]|uniref:Uncharacterized protein n=1 Tax=Budvicia aquatica TaxID=82979 RepID=A0A2C6CST9_9GAMM|nr:hypothetical protein CRN84_10465 [Budvicia aquatica]